MPLKMDQKDRRLMLGGGVLFVALIVAAAFFSGNGTKEEIPSTYSTASGGAKAAYMLLADAGFQVARWEKPLKELPHGTGDTLILANPAQAPTREDKDRLKKFVSAGGRVIATGNFAGTYLPESNSLPIALGGVTRAKAVSPSQITRAAPEITIAPDARWESLTPAYPLYADGDQTLVVKYPYGRGEVLWWASAMPLTNSGLKEPGNMEFLLACARETKGRILWDEYIHGYRETLGSAMGNSPVKWLALQLALLALAVLATFSRRSGPISAPAAVVRLSPLEFVETLGGLYEHADTASVAVDICYQRFRYWLTKRLGLASNTPLEELRRAVEDRFALRDERFSAVMRRCESAKNDPYLQGPEALHLVQELDEFAARMRLFTGRKEKVG